MEPQPRPRKSTILIDLAHAIVLSLIAVLLLWLDFLEIQKRSNRASEDAIYHLMAPLQGARFTSPLQGVREPDEPIVVVTIDTEDLKAINRAREADYGGLPEVPVSELWTWPLDGYKHREIAETLADLKPRAVFYDINFATKRDGIKDFAGALRTLSKGTPSSRECVVDAHKRPAGAPALFLSYEPNSPPLGDLCANGAEAAVTGWVGQDNAYPLMEIMTECSQLDCSEPPAEADRFKLRVRHTAAYALFSLWCDDQLKSSGANGHPCSDYRGARTGELTARLHELRKERADAFRRLDQLRADEFVRAQKLADEKAEEARRPSQKLTAPPPDTPAINRVLAEIRSPNYVKYALSLQWGMGVSPEQARFTKIDSDLCVTTPTGVLEKAGTFFDRFATAILATLKLNGEEKATFRCPYALTIPLRLLMYPDTERRDAIAKAIAGRFVMIGVSDITGLGDVVESPVHGQLPGVYMHAQATENLMRSAGSFFDVVTAPKSDVQIISRNAIYFVLMTAFLTLSLQIGRRATRSAISFDRLIQHGSPVRLRAAIQRSLQGLNRVLVLGSLTLILPAFFAAIFYWFFWIDRTAPLDWVGIAGTMFLTMAAIVWRSLGQILAELAVAFPPTSNLARKFLAMLHE